MHGEFAVPGGELVAVDFDVVDGLIANFRLTGTFLLETASVLELIASSVNGLPADTEPPRLADVIRRALGGQAAIVGFGPESVATAIRRALHNATGWRDYEWQLISGPALNPVLQMALDQVLTEEVGAGRRKPTLRFWEWNDSAVVIGSFQSVKNEVDLERAREHGFEIVRRISGGGAMFMQAGAVITYSIYAPIELVQGMSFIDSYAFLDDWVIVALRSIGVDAHYEPLNDIRSPTAKIGGAAQKRLGAGAVLHHATLSYDLSNDRMLEVLRIGRERLSTRGTTSANKLVDPLRGQTTLTREQIMDVMISTFRALHGLTPGEITEDEMAQARVLASEKFGTDAWLQRVP